MGNQPSTPSPQAPLPPQAPPIPPPCDMECQRNNELASLKLALDEASKTKDIDPEKYEQARIGYFTLLKGQGWLQEEKKRIADKDIAPLIREFTRKYNSLKGEQKTQSIYVNLTNALEAQQTADESTQSYLKQQMEAEKTKARRLERLSQLGGSQSINWISTVVEGLIAFFGLLFVYLVFTKRNVFMNIVSSQQNESVSSMLGGW